MSDGAPAAEVDISPDLLKRLLATQAPQWATLPITLFDEGWDNTLFRLGEDMLVRLPRRAIAVPLLESEQRVLGHLGPRLPNASPVPIHIGTPGEGFPWPWSITPYIDGSTLDLDPLSREGVMEWTHFLLALHQKIIPGIDPSPPVNPHRGVPLRVRDEGLIQRVDQIKALGCTLDERLVELWEAALLAPPSEFITWLHGDPHPRNAISRNGHLQAVLDWGDVTSGDPASDLASLWMVAHTFENRRDALDVYSAAILKRFPECNIPALRLRAMGWALLYGIIHLATGLVNHPAHAAIGRSTLQNLLRDLA